MKFLKIQLTRANTLNVVYKTDDGDVVDFKGANIVHKDMRQAIHLLIPHIAMLTEQREAVNCNLKQLQAQSITDDDVNSVFKRLDVDCVTFTDDEHEAAVSGCRILLSGCVIKLASPSVCLADDENYTYHDELAADIEAVKYEARQYLDDRKWGVKQTEIAFEDPFKGNVEAGDVPDAGPVDGEKPKKRGRKAKKEAA